MKIQYKFLLDSGAKHNGTYCTQSFMNYYSLKSVRCIGVFEKA